MASQEESLPPFGGKASQRRYLEMSVAKLLSGRQSYSGYFVLSLGFVPFCQISNSHKFTILRKHVKIIDNFSFGKGATVVANKKDDFIYF